ncbi:MAG: nuclear transport factor 2 family protein [Acidobacteriota bacterium]
MRFAILLLTATAAACGAAAPAPASAGDLAAQTTAIEATLDDWHAAAAEADEARYFSHFAEDAVYLGTDATERWDVEAFRRYAHPHFAEGRAWTFRAARRAVVVAPDGDVAWFDEDLVTENLGPARGSGVVVRGASGRWLIVHYNLTITVPNDRFREVRDLLRAPPTTGEG